MVKIKNKLNNRLILTVTFVILSVIILIFFMINVLLTSKVIYEEKEKILEAIEDKRLFYEDLFSEDNCRCFERERLKCSGEFELVEEKRLCKKGNEITNVLLGCSKYECSGQVYIFNFYDKEWETKK